MSASPEDIRKHRRAVLCCVIAGLAVLAGIACRALLLPHLLALKGQQYQGLPYMLYEFSVPPVTYLAAGVLLASLIALIARIRLPMPLRVVFLVLGTATCIIPLFFSLEAAAMLASSQLRQPIFSGFGYVMMSKEFLRLFFRCLPFAGGILLRLGFGR